MAEVSQQPAQPATPGTGEGQNPPAAIPQQPQGAATEDNEMITIPKKDYTEMQSQRDRNHNDKLSAEQRAAATENYVLEQLQKEDIRDFLSDSDNKKKYPDVVVDDLMTATSKAEFEEIAARQQARIDKAADRKLNDIEKATDPVLSPDERAAREKKLKENPGAASFEEMINLRSQ